MKVELADEILFANGRLNIRNVNRLPFISWQATRSRRLPTKEQRKSEQEANEARINRTWREGRGLGRRSSEWREEIATREYNSTARRGGVVVGGTLAED